MFLAKDARGQGIVTRTVEAMMDWAFGERDLRRLEWRCAPGNEPSRAIPRRLGFTHEGTLRQAFRVREDFHDLEVWSLLATSGAHESDLACQPGSGSCTTRPHLADKRSAWETAIRIHC